MPTDLSNDNAAARTAAALPETAVSRAVAAGRTPGLRPTTGVNDVTSQGDGVDPDTQSVKFGGTSADANTGRGGIDGSSARVRLLEAVSRATASNVPETLQVQLQHKFEQQLDMGARQEVKPTATEALADAQRRVNNGRPEPTPRGVNAVEGTRPRSSTEITKR